MLQGWQRYRELKPCRSEHDNLSKSSLHSRAHHSTTTQCKCTQLVHILSWHIIGWRWEYLEGREWRNEWEKAWEWSCTR